MAETSNLPDLGAQVRPLVQALPGGIQPRLMARLERAAADRYQTWAALCPEPAQAEGLRACGLREQEVAKRVEALFPSQPDEDRHLRDALPRIAEAYRAAPGEPSCQRPVRNSGGGRTTRCRVLALASSFTDVPVREALGMCADLEERSAEFLETLLAETP